MLSIVVVDTSAETRSAMVKQVSDFFANELDENGILPKVSIKPLSRDELKFAAAPDICLLGENLVRNSIGEVANIRRLLPNTAILVKVGRAQATLAFIEHLVRLGADDVLTEDVGPTEFFKKIIIFARRLAKAKTGRLIVVDGAKGGVGTTSVVAGLGDALANTGKRVALIDFDLESQDLSRFLRAKPFINENLQLLFDQLRPVTQEFVEQCLVRVWADEDNFFCVPPACETDSIYDSRLAQAKILIPLLEILDSTFDCVLVDVACLRGGLLKALYRSADEVVLVVNNDPATVHAAVDRVRRIRAQLSVNTKLLLLNNAPTKWGLSETVLRSELSFAAQLGDENWISNSLPFCKSGCRWAGSGATLFSMGAPRVVSELKSVIQQLGLGPAVEEAKASAALQKAASVFSRLSRTGRKQIIHANPVRGLVTGGDKLGLPEPTISNLKEETDLTVKNLISAPSFST